MLFVVLCQDKPGALQIRKDTRTRHLEFAKSLGSKLKLGGPFLNDEDEMVGSMLIIEAETKEDAVQISRQDPYFAAGLFESVDVRPWKWSINAPAAV